MSELPTERPASGQKVVLITGANPGGIGGALAVEFVEAGYFVICALRRPHLAEAIKRPGLVPLFLDVKSTASVESAAETVAKLTDGKLDVLVNNAGLAEHLPALDFDIDSTAYDMFDVNVLGVMRTVKAFSSLLIRSKGSIVNIGSIAPIIPLAFSTTYNATKAALHAYGEGLRIELAPLGVRVTTIVTGGVKSNIVRSTNPRLPENSRYLPMTESWLKRVHLSQISAVATEDYAREVVKMVASGRSPNWFWAGGSAVIARFVHTFIPRSWMLNYVSRWFGFSAAKLS